MVMCPCSVVLLECVCIHIPSKPTGDLNCNNIAMQRSKQKSVACWIELLSTFVLLHVSSSSTFVCCRLQWVCQWTGQTDWLIIEQEMVSSVVPRQHSITHGREGITCEQSGFTNLYQVQAAIIISASSAAIFFGMWQSHVLQLSTHVMSTNAFTDLYKHNETVKTHEPRLLQLVRGCVPLNMINCCITTSNQCGIHVQQSYYSFSLLLTILDGMCGQLCAKMTGYYCLHSLSCLCVFWL